ncbi:GDH/6PGL endoplasmic bifunctional protein [Spea bombifrons]|uniref:GDH/6PGL endoplasmic bifunctional protein n=1 Tax=Spea bombifrons TaxID=233779 RepID=UPI00234B1D5C|nr:GDH/6PGL endoplasmic bifunctional protein [Spea bombifrons]XP_053308324.1 GDH/6PGL endoplasmic bifunctional protein [Spea bombifrons]XP_053308325.1 GDH/6PGL endoplasmic bifunctional protein [Spea bombifrons]
MLQRALCCLFLFGTVAVISAGGKGHISVVLLGATGDLAKKYLWQGIFHLYINEVYKGHSFTFYGAALTPPEKGEELLFNILTSLSCPVDLEPDRCVLLKDQFLKLSSYRQLKTAEHYTALHQDIQRSLSDEGIHEAGRLFYLSVPPFAYADIAQNINGSCRPLPGAWLRVVLEKPFGRDYGSAKKLADDLQTVFREEEIYRVDHYLGKQTVEQILPFRLHNQKHLDLIWNRHHVERVEIVLKETLDAKGRISFYEEYGVIRDVLQNHLTEILTSVAMEVPHNLTNSDDILRAKLDVLESLDRMDQNRAVVGQYQNYLSQVKEEMETKPNYFTSTPTFAAVLVYINNMRWEGVPFLLVSGKALEERSSYVRVVFKDNVFCVQKGENQDPLKDACKPKQIIFHIGHGELGFPAVLVSKGLFKPKLMPSKWQKASELPSTSVFGQPLSDYYVYRPIQDRDAYTILISNIYYGRKGSFITTKNLLASWKFWTPLLESLEQESPRVYPEGSEYGQLLDFAIEDGSLHFVTDEHLEILDVAEKINKFGSPRSTFLGNPMVSDWAEQLIQKLSQDIQAEAKLAIKRSGAFHLALSGGSSPLALFQRLSRHLHGFPWKNTHLWLVDERCVPFSDPESNFGNLEKHLLQHVRLPYVNIHPMPILRNQRLCAEEDMGNQTYAEDISALVGNTSFDFILLGLGNDGHTASIFPGNEEGIKGDSLVLFTESPSRPHQRMSLSLALINKAHKVAVLVLGKGKHDIITLISRAESNPKKWPIQGVKPTSGQLVWYVDYDALLK